MSRWRHVTQGEFIANRLKLKRLSINRAADLAGVSREHLSKVVNDQRGLGPDVARKIAPVLEVSPERLLALREADAETRRGFDLRLRELEAEVTLWKELLLEALLLLGLRANLEADPGQRVRRRVDRQRRAAG